MEIDFYVTLSMEETAEKLKDGLNGRIVKAELLSEYQRKTKDGKSIRQMILRQSTFAMNDLPILVVTLDDFDEHTKVHLSSLSAVAGIMADTEQGRSMAVKAKRILKEYQAEK